MDEDWLSAAETRDHVAAALVAAGDKAENAPGAIFAKAAFGHETLAATAIDISRGARFFGGDTVAPMFWGCLLTRSLSQDWATGHFTTEHVQQNALLGTARQGLRGDRVTRLFASGVRFRRRQVEQLWPLPTKHKATDRSAKVAPARSALQAAAALAKAKFEALPLNELAAMTINDWEGEIIRVLQQNGGTNRYKEGSIAKAAGEARRAVRNARGLNKGHASRHLAVQTG